MPIDVNKIIPNKNLAILDGILKGVSGIKKAEEEKQQSFIKNMFEQFKLQQENRKIDVSERLATVSEQRVQDDYAKQVADIENAKNKVTVDITTNQITRDRLTEEIRKNDPINYKKIQDIENESRYSAEDKYKKQQEVRIQSIQEQAEKRKADLDLQYKYGTTEIPTGGTAGIDARQKEKEIGLTVGSAMDRTLVTTQNQRAIAEYTGGNQRAIAEYKVTADIIMGDKKIASAEKIASMKGGLSGNANFDIKTYNDKNKIFTDDVTRIIEISGGDLNKLKPAESSALLSRQDALIVEHNALIEQYPERANTIQLPNLNLYIDPEGKKAHWYGGKAPALKVGAMQVTPIQKSALVIQRNTVPADQENYRNIINLGSELKSRFETRAEAKSFLLDKGFNSVTIDKALRTIYNE